MKLSRDLASKFAGFFLAGAVGFVVDGGILYALKAPLGPYLARVVSFSVAVFATFLINRFVVFADRPHRSFFRSLGSYVAANGMGGLLNFAMYSGMVWSALPVIGAPMAAFAIASALALAFNFTMTNVFVFRR